MRKARMEIKLIISRFYLDGQQINHDDYLRGIMDDRGVVKVDEIILSAFFEGKSLKDARNAAAAYTKSLYLVEKIRIAQAENIPGKMPMVTVRVDSESLR